MAALVQNSKGTNVYTVGLATCFGCTLTGKIPLRQLVYRVLDLPPSMRPLVYDFGQLNMETEKEYTEQIVRNTCRCKEFPELHGFVGQFTNILAWSQNYMRERKVSQAKIIYFIQVVTVHFVG